MVQSQNYLVSKPWKEMEGVHGTSERLGVSKVQDWSMAGRWQPGIRAVAAGTSNV